MSIRFKIGLLAILTSYRLLACPSAIVHSSARITVLEGPQLHLWSRIHHRLNANKTSDSDERFYIDQETPQIIGRPLPDGERPEYLDERYLVTPLVNTLAGPQTILSGKDDDLISGGHLMLRYHPSGLVVVNAVPRKGGGLRAPTNATWVISPEHRKLMPKEFYLIEHGRTARIWLPNGTALLISVD